MIGLRLRVYLNDKWNWISMLSLITYVVALGLQHGPAIGYFEAARILRALNFMLFAYQLLRYMTAFEMWGILVPVLYRMVSAFGAVLELRFSAIFLLVFICFSQNFRHRAIHSSSKRNDKDMGRNQEGWG